MRELDRLSQWLNLAILPQPRVLRRDPPLRRHSRSLDDGQTRAALDDAPEMRLVPHGMVSIFGRILAHGGHYDAVLESKPPQLERLKDFWDGGRYFGVEDSGPGWD